MLIIEKSIHVSLPYTFENYNLNEMVFFDIETTGFSPETTALYLIGCIYYKEEQFHITQWFADDYSSEANILHEFFHFINDYKVLVHYNGTGFDIPYLLKKCKSHNLEYNFDAVDSLDIYKRIYPYKKIFKTENLKQKTMEQFLGVQRNDKYSGGELINVYREYLQHKRMKDGEDTELYNLLILHNEEDLKGMLTVSQILCYADLFDKNIEINKVTLEDEHLQIKFLIPNPLPKRISYGNDTVYLSAFDHQGTIRITLYKNELKFFYDNYKDYYYLPNEDTAIHKSVAFYVDKDFRTRAKAANCYSKRTGCFVPQFEEILHPYFKIDYYDKIKYVETTKEFLTNYTDLTKYVKHLFKYLINRVK